jgi:fermentation-respiration switch protein FrsA (DUF1100 family)
MVGGLMRRPAAKIALAGAVLLGLLAAAIAALPFVITPFIFWPDAIGSADPSRWGLRQARSVMFAAADGSALSGWWLAPPTATAATVLLVHGRSGNISSRASIARRLRADGFGVLLFDYRGYGASEGTPSERGISEDALSAYAWLRAQGISPGRLIVIGQSLGNAPAAQLTSNRPVAGLVLVSPFVSLPEAAADRLPWLPIRAVPWPRNRFEVQASLAGSAPPLIFIASRGDDLVPFAHSARLDAALDRRARWIVLPSAPHDGLLAEATHSGALTGALRALTPA